MSKRNLIILAVVLLGAWMWYKSKKRNAASPPSADDPAMRGESRPGLDLVGEGA